MGSNVLEGKFLAQLFILFFSLAAQAYAFSIELHPSISFCTFYLVRLHPDVHDYGQLSFINNFLDEYITDTNQLKSQKNIAWVISDNEFPMYELRNYLGTVNMTSVHTFTYAPDKSRYRVIGKSCSIVLTDADQVDTRPRQHRAELMYYYIWGFWLTHGANNKHIPISAGETIIFSFARRDWEFPVLRDRHTTVFTAPVLSFIIFLRENSKVGYIEWTCPHQCKLETEHLLLHSPFTIKFTNYLVSFLSPWEINDRIRRLWGRPLWYERSFSWKKLFARPVINLVIEEFDTKSLLRSVCADNVISILQRISRNKRQRDYEKDLCGRATAFSWAIAANHLNITLLIGQRLEDEEDYHNWYPVYFNGIAMHLGGAGHVSKDYLSLESGTFLLSDKRFMLFLYCHDKMNYKNVWNVVRTFIRYFDWKLWTGTFAVSLIIFIYFIVEQGVGAKLASMIVFEIAAILLQQHAFPISRFRIMFVICAVILSASYASLMKRDIIVPDKERLPSSLVELLQSNYKLVERVGTHVKQKRFANVSEYQVDTADFVYNLHMPLKTEKFSRRLLDERNWVSLTDPQTLTKPPNTIHAINWVTRQDRLRKKVIHLRRIVKVYKELYKYFSKLIADQFSDEAEDIDAPEESDAANCYVIPKEYEMLKGSEFVWIQSVIRNQLGRVISRIYFDSGIRNFRGNMLQEKFKKQEANLTEIYKQRIMKILNINDRFRGAVQLASLTLIPAIVALIVELNIFRRDTAKTITVVPAED